jgi:beta-alanine degradation protein BauB
VVRAAVPAAELRADKPEEDWAMHEDAVHAAPKMYKVLLENHRVRVLEARIKAGVTAPMHSHPGSVVYFLSDAKAKFIFPDGKTEIIEGKKGQVMWHDHLAHAVEDIANHEAHVLIVELKH